MADADRRRPRRGDRRCRATRATSSSPSASLTCSPPGSAPSRSASGTTARTGSTPSTGTSGCAVTSPGSAPSVARPARVRQLRQRGRERDAGGDPDRGLHHRAHDRGHPRRLRDRERGAHTAERLLLEHDRRRRRRARRSARASSSERMHSSAAIGTSTRRRTAARSSSDATGCSTYSRSNAREPRDHRDRGVDVPRAVGVDPHAHVADRPRRAPRATSATPDASRTFTFTAGKAAHVLHEERAVDERVHRHRRRARAGGKPTRGSLLGRARGTPRDRSDIRRAASTRPTPPGPRAA